MRTLVAAVLLTWSLLANAQTFQSQTTCAEWQVIGQIIAQFGEQPALQGLSNRILDGQRTQVVTIIFLNPVNHSFTTIEKWGDDMFCVIQTGESLVPYNAN